MIYLDSAATSFQKPGSVKRAVANAMDHCSSVGRGGYRPACNAAEMVLSCRELASQMFCCEPEQVVFTMNATHGLNMAIATLVKPNSKVVISGFEHNAVLRPLHRLQANICIAGRKLYDPADTLKAFENAVTRDTDAVICTHVSNVFGYILPVEQIAALCRSRGVPFVLDASQSAGVLPVSLRELGADFIAMPGHKGLCGPQGTGLLLCGRLPKPLLCGGTGSLSQQADMPDFLPDRGEAGTHNVPGICGLREGLRFVSVLGTQNILRHEQQLRRKMTAILRRYGGARVFAGCDECHSGVLSFCPETADCESFAAVLGKKGIAVRAGLHCSPLAHESAGTLERGTVRVSFSAFSTEGQAEMVANIIGRLLMKQK